MLHAALERAVKERLISRNPTEDCIAPKPRKLQMQILPPEAIHAYLEAAKARELLPMFYLELVGGLRKGELLALRWDNADIQNRTISVSKQHILDPDDSQELTRPKTENLMRLLSIPQTAVDLLTQEHNKHPDCPTCSPPRLPGKCTPPYSVVNLHKKILKGRRAPPHPLPRPAAHLRYHSPSERRGCKNGVLHAGTLRCRVHSPHLHPRHTTETGRSSSHNGQLYGTDHVRQRKRPDGKRKLHVRHSLALSACGSRCGSTN